MVSPSGGVELTYQETDTTPICVVTFAASRITASDKLDDRIVRIDFIGGAFTKTHWHGDMAGPESIGYTSVEPNVDAWPMLDTWALGDLCPCPSFYHVEQSDCVPTLPPMFHSHKHFLVDGRDGCVEVAVEGYFWAEWLWQVGHRFDTVLKAEPVARGQMTG